LERIARCLRGAAPLLGLDFDGTLAPIVDTPAQARAVPGTAAVLNRLARQVTVLIVSGRPVQFLRAQLGDELELVGLYGLEGWRDGQAWEHPEADDWRVVVNDVAAALEDAAAGLLVERKGLTVTVHYRGQAHREAEVRQLAERLGPPAGLRVEAAKMSFELQPPLPTDKGAVLAQRLPASDGAVFVGDDLGDLSAFEALAAVAADRPTCRVAVHSAESPPELLANADVLLAGPAAVLSVLDRLPQAVRQASPMGDGSE
jgi:trehalose 6-phosphate phosphatase